jgi:hypothetical protein
MFCDMVMLETFVVFGAMEPWAFLVGIPVS